MPGYRDDLILNSYLSFGVNKRFPTLLQQISSPAMIVPSSYAVTNLNPEKNTSTELSIVLGKDIQEDKTSTYGGKNIRYKRGLKDKSIKQFQTLHNSIIPWNKIRYIF